MVMETLEPKAALLVALAYLKVLLLILVIVLEYFVYFEVTRAISIDSYLVDFDISIAGSEIIKNDRGL